jgi:hypothetical protein
MEGLGCELHDAHGTQLQISWRTKELAGMLARSSSDLPNINCADHHHPDQQKIASGAGGLLAQKADRS